MQTGLLAGLLLLPLLGATTGATWDALLGRNTPGARTRLLASGGIFLADEASAWCLARFFYGVGLLGYAAAIGACLLMLRWTQLRICVAPERTPPQVYIYIYIHMYVYIYIHIYVYTHTNIHIFVCAVICIMSVMSHFLPIYKEISLCNKNTA